MIPAVAQRGRSFKGAGLYYLHDKQAKTNERVEWTMTHNLPTRDPHKAMKWMAHTAMNAERLKEENGTARTGRKSGGKVVYAYSLSWHSNDNPKREEMEKAAFSSLEKLGLKDHEAVIVAHRDREHPHVHIVCNLVNPKTGKTKSMSMDFNQLSTWAQEHDKEHGRDHCPERTRNNAERYKGKAKAQFVKHNQNPEKLIKALQIQTLYDKTKSGEEFKQALEKEGYTIAMGSKGRITLVDQEGQVCSLGRQIKGENGRALRARQIKEKLEGVDLKSLPSAKELSEQRQFHHEHFDRDYYAAQQEEKMFDAAIEASDAKAKAEREERQKAKEQARQEKKEEMEFIANYDDSHLEKIDKTQAWHTLATRKRHELREQQEKIYKRKEMVARIKALEKKVAANDNIFGKLTGKRQDLMDELEAERKNLANADWRIEEQRSGLEKELLEKHPYRDELKEKKDVPKEDRSEEFNDKAKRIEDIKDKLKAKAQNRSRSPGRHLKR
ncbi:MAG: relaxase/mobilization nuclease domain-containing protein [Bacteroidota bacterium]